MKLRRYMASDVSEKRATFIFKGQLKTTFIRQFGMKIFVDEGIKFLHKFCNHSHNDTSRIGKPGFSNLIQK